MPDMVAPEFIALQQAVAGRYSLERELGRGGMGIVFLARDVALDRPVAIKLLPPALAQRPGLVDRFLREARTAAKLSQPNIVPIHAVEQAGDLVFFVMAYIEGQTLGERLRGAGPLTPHDAARMLQEVAWALGYAHGRGVVHRDIKPDNIMLERGTGRAIVMDFGIAALAGGGGGDEVVGTAQYISPEQASGDAADGRSDLYSLGVVGFLALTGRLPFEASDTAGLIAMHLTRPAPKVASFAPALPRRLAQAVDRCLAKAPADRFPDGEAMAEAVAQAIEPKRQLPVPVRLWLTKGHESLTSYFLWYIMAGPGFGLMIGATVAMGLGLGPVLGWIAGISAYLLTPIVLKGSYRLWRLRLLLAEGYSFEDARLAVRDAAERRREELTYEYGAEPPLWAKAARKLMFVSGASCVGLFVALFFNRHGPSAAHGYALLGTAITWFGSAFLQTIKPGKVITRDAQAEWRLAFWNSRFAKWFEKLARIGLTRRATPAELTYRPTELAISLAADALFAALPKDQRRELKALPKLLEALQRDAQLMRRTVDDLNGAIDGLGDHSAAAQSSALAGPGGQQAADARASLRTDLVRRRDDAAARLAAAVSALESIRLNLLRLRAGTGTLAEVTADLSAARALEADLDAQVAGQREVERLLGRATRPPQARTPTPRPAGA